MNREKAAATAVPYVRVGLRSGVMTAPRSALSHAPPVESQRRYS